MTFCDKDILIEDEGILYSIHGKCNEERLMCNWKLNNETKELIIEGSGNINDYENIEDQPWFEYNNQITSITIEGITNIGKQAFTNMENVISISIGSNTTSLGENSFEGMKTLESIDVVEDNVVYLSEEGVLYTKDKTTLIKYPINKSSE